MTVVEKIHTLSDELLCLQFVSHLTETEQARKTQLQEQLRVIKASCPVSWAKASVR